MHCVGDLFGCVLFVSFPLFFLVWVLECAYWRYTGQVGGEKMGGKLAFAESTNGIQFTRTEGPSLVICSSPLDLISRIPPLLLGHSPDCKPQI